MLLFVYSICTIVVVNDPKTILVCDTNSIHNIHAILINYEMSMRNKSTHLWSWAVIKCYHWLALNMLMGSYKHIAWITIIIIIVVANQYACADRIHCDVCWLAADSSLFFLHFFFSDETMAAHSPLVRMDTYCDTWFSIRFIIIFISGHRDRASPNSVHITVEFSAGTKTYTHGTYIVRSLLAYIRCQLFSNIHVHYSIYFYLI